MLIHPEYSNRVSVLTGPNYSGKSIYLKQIAIIVFLAHIGSYVPAESCKLGLFDGIYTAFNSLESFDFSWELSNLLCIMKSCSNRSLILFDEFGKNTDYLNGSSMFC